jgi:putative two-component system response regulator
MLNYADQSRAWESSGDLQSPGAKRTARILVVDDEEGVRRSLGRLLKRAGHRCELAGSGDEAIAAFEKEPFDLVLSDVNMPGLSGIELAHKLKEQYPDVAVVMVTAVDDTEIAEAALEEGAYGYLIKPCESNELLINVANALRRQSLEIENRIHREALEQVVAERTQELRQAVEDLEAKESALRASNEEMIHRLAKAAEFRDNETAQHVQRMSRYCALMARELGMPEQRCDQIRLASLMHDVGKIGIPDRILLKPGKLTDQEFDLMRSHCEIGYRILSGSDAELLCLARSIAFTHHEKYDGRGYPRGLAGEQIPIEGRIAAVADVFDALTSKRVYKEAMHLNRAVAILKQERGTHFEPRLVDLFLESMPEVLKIRARYADSTTSEHRALADLEQGVKLSD